MGEVFNFNNEEECCKCETCDLIDEFFEYAISSDTPEELREILTGLVNEAKVIGYKDAIKADLNLKMKVLNNLEGCDCEICDEENCELD